MKGDAVNDRTAKAGGFALALRMHRRYASEQYGRFTTALPGEPDSECICMADDRKPFTRRRFASSEPDRFSWQGAETGSTGAVPELCLHTQHKCITKGAICNPMRNNTYDERGAAFLRIAKVSGFLPQFL
jgi:hypothetical protein